MNAEGKKINTEKKTQSEAESCVLDKIQLVIIITGKIVCFFSVNNNEMSASLMVDWTEVKAFHFTLSNCMRGLTEKSDVIYIYLYVCIDVEIILHCAKSIRYLTENNICTNSTNT